jgi:acyl-CoA synthetase (AMP-forming)/AMP-acid ligase II
MRTGGWYATGDIGYLDNDGALFVVGRLKEMIVRSGFNVYPVEVETAINAFPLVQQSAVVGVPTPGGSEDIVAFVQPTRAGAVIDILALDMHLRERLASYKIPSRMEVIEELPMTISGKILKRQLLASCSAAENGDQTHRYVSARVRDC